MLWCLAVWLPDLRLFFTDSGVLHRGDFAGRFDWARFSLLRFADGYLLALCFWIIGFFSALALLLGYRARFAALICWFIYLNFVGRNPMIIQGGDILMPLLLFWMIFLPISAVFSVDAALDPIDRRGRKHLSIATIGLLLQVVYVYVFGALLKSGPAWTPDGSALYAALHIDSFVTPMGRLLREHISLMQLLTFFVYFLELLTPILLFFPDKRQFVRMLTLGALWMMHLGFRIFLHIGHFWLASLTSLCAYVPGRVWDWASGWYFSESQRQIRIYFDRDCGFCLKVALVLREFFLPRCVTVTPAQDDPKIGEVLERETSWVVIDHQGDQRLRWDAVVYVMSQSVVLRPFGWLVKAYGMIGLGDPTYKAIGDNRKGFGAIISRLLSTTKTIPQLNVPVQIGLGLVMIFCLFWNIQGLRGSFQPLSDLQQISRTAQSAGFTQRWTMFAPSPPTLDGFPVFAAVRADGSMEDIFTYPPRELSFETPDDVVGLFDSARQRAFVLKSWLMGGEDRNMFFTRLVKIRCQEVNDGRSANERVLSVVVHYIENQTKSHFEEEVRQYEVTRVLCPVQG